MATAAPQFIDGFDHYATADLLKKWTSGTTGLSITANGRTGSCLEGTLSGATWLVKTLGGTATCYTMGGALRANTTLGGNAASGFFQFREGATVHVSASSDSTGAINVYRGNGTTLLGSTAAAKLVINTYVHVEVKVRVHASAGTIDVLVNGVSALSLTGQNTQNGGSGIIDTVAVAPFFSATTNISRIDDFFVAQATPLTSDFLGDSIIETLFPTADGTYLQLTPSTGTSHFTLVKETVPNTTDYNFSNTAPNKDTYQMADMVGQTFIYAAQVLCAVALDAAVSTQACTTLRSGSTDWDGAAIVLTTTAQTYLMDCYGSDPGHAGFWTQAGIQQLQCGMKVAVSGANVQNSQTVLEVLRSASIPGNIGGVGIERGFYSPAPGRPGMQGAPRSVLSQVPESTTYQRSARGLGSNISRNFRPVGYPIG